MEPLYDCSQRSGTESGGQSVHVLYRETFVI